MITARATGSPDRHRHLPLHRRRRIDQASARARRRAPPHDTQGDAFFFAFLSAPGVVATAQEITNALAPGVIHLRIGLHTGTPLVTDEGYVGDDVHSLDGAIALARSLAETFEE